MNQYSISLIWSDEDKGYIATVPEFKNLSAFGKTAEEALKEAQVALDGYVKSIEEDGEQLPEPQKVNIYSGQIRVRMPKQLHKSLALSADGEGVSLNTFMVHLLSTNYAVYKCQKNLPTPLFIMEKTLEQNTNYIMRSRANINSSVVLGLKLASDLGPTFKMGRFEA